MLNIFLLKKKFSDDEISEAIKEAEKIETQAKELTDIMWSFTKKIFDYSHRHDLDRVRVMSWCCNMMSTEVKNIFAEELKPNVNTDKG